VPVQRQFVQQRLLYELLVVYQVLLCYRLLGGRTLQGRSQFAP